MNRALNEAKKAAALAAFLFEPSLTVGLMPRTSLRVLLPSVPTG